VQEIIKNKQQMKNIGIVFVTAGLIMVIITGFNLASTKSVVDFRTIHITKQKKYPMQWTSAIRGILIAGGIVLEISKKNKA
jgi:hypothetical protein